MPGPEVVNGKATDFSSVALEMNHADCAIAHIAPDTNAGSTAGKKKRPAKKKAAKADTLALSVPVSLNINVLVDRVSEAKATLYD